MSIAGRLVLGLSTFASIWCVVGVPAAAAAPPQAPGTQQTGGPPKKQQPLILTRETADVGVGDRARARARAGDCKAALDQFDVALRTSVDPTLKRDRGLCHEQLQHPYPAIDDYRAYLSARPAATDSDQIRERLLHLEEQMGLNVRTNDHVDNPDVTPQSDASASATLTINGEGASTNASTASRPKSMSQTDFERDEKLAAAASGSPLRESSGWVLGPYFSVRQSGDITTTLGAASGKIKMGVNETVGGALRYSLGKTSSIISEFGYVGFNDANVAGPGFFLGYEARIALTRWTSDAIILGGGLGYERYRASDTGAILNNLLPRARLGYRHVFGPTLGLEVHGDGGVGYYFLKDAPDGLSLSVTPVFGVYLALLVGF